MANLSEKERQLIDPSEIAQRQLRSFVAESSTRFSDLEKQALDTDSVTTFDKFWKSTGSARQKFENEHASGHKKFARSAMEFGSTAHDALHSLSPLIDVIKDFGAPYGSLAIGTITFFMAIAKSRSRMEQRIGTTMAAIGDRLTGLVLYKKIYSDEDELDQELQSILVVAYSQFIGFCIAAIKFYSAGGLRRLQHALVPPTEVDILAQDIACTFKQIRLKCEELLSKNVAKIKQLTLDQEQLIKEQREEIKGLRTDIEAMVWQNRLEKIANLMGMETFSDDSEQQQLRAYEVQLEDDQSVSGPYVEHMSDKTYVDIFRTNRHFTDWSQSQESSMLILTGYNHFSIMESAYQCWTSPVAMRTFKELRTNKIQGLCALYIVGRRKSESLSGIIFSLLLQLLKSRPASLLDHKQHEELLAELKMYQKTGPAHDPEHELLRKIAIRVLNLFTVSQTVWLLVDRVHRCLKRDQLMEIFVYLLNSARTRVRMLIIADGSYWQLDKSLKEIKGAKSQKIISYAVHQKSLGDMQ